MGKNQVAFAKHIKDPKWVEEHRMLYVGFVDGEHVASSAFLNDLIGVLQKEYPNKFHLIRQVKKK